MASYRAALQSWHPAQGTVTRRPAFGNAADWPPAVFGEVCR